MHVRTINWRTNYSAVFTPKTNAQYEAWVEFLSENLDELAKDEINRAVAVLCNIWKDRYAPKVTDILYQIKRTRRETDPNRWRLQEKAAESESHETKATKKKILHEPDQTKIWNIICHDGGDQGNCALLERYAISTHPEYADRRNDGSRYFRRPHFADIIKDGERIVTAQLSKGIVNNVSKEFVSNDYDPKTQF